MDNASRNRSAQTAREEKKKKRRDKILGAKIQSRSVKDFDSARKVVPYTKGMGSDFYATNEWRRLRWLVISTSSGKCNVCGRSHKVHGVVLHVDHVKPRSKYPSLELDISNMQVLCEDCNIGKGANPQLF